jgi:hypothetical protein
MRAKKWRELSECKQQGTVEVAASMAASYVIQRTTDETYLPTLEFRSFIGMITNTFI